MEQRVLIITNDATKCFAPDLIQIRFNYEALHDTYETASNEAAKKTRVVREALVEAGFDGTLLKESSFDIYPETKSYKGKDDQYHEAFLGYKTTINFIVDLPNDSLVLSKALYALRENEGSIRLCPMFKDKEAAKQEVMAEAVRGALQKAEVIAESAGVMLGSIMKIDYSKSRVDFRFEETDECCLPASRDCMAAPEIDYNPEFRRLSESVTITWEII